MQNKKWEIISKLNNRDIIDVLLKNRGINSAHDKKEFVHPTHPEKLSLKDFQIDSNQVKKAIDRIKQSLKAKQKVIVYGDYDADGVTGTAILWETLYSLGLNVLPFIPDRFSEGYGLNIDSISKLKSQNPDLKLIITVDHGIVAYKQVKFAKNLGIDVIITDHHQPEKTKPPAYATIHTTNTGGAAVAWILSREIKKKALVNTYRLRPSLELVAIGTIADQLPLIGPNRAFVKYGLEELRRTKRVGLLELFNESGIDKDNIGPYDIGFVIAPRINSMGRLTHAIDSLRLICTREATRAKNLASILARSNKERQKIVEEVVFHAKSRADNFIGQLIVLADEGYHEGVIGLAAAKIVEEFYRPAIVISKKDKVSKASARSIPGLNIIKLIRKVKDLWLEGGGHPMAAGFSIETSKIELFSKRINQHASRLLKGDLLARKLNIDLEIDFTDITQDLLARLKVFEPFGIGNPTPVFASREVYIETVRRVGRDNKHLKLKLKQKEKVFDAIGFGIGELYPQLSANKPVDVAFSLEENVWNGETNIQLKAKDLKI